MLILIQSRIGALHTHQPNISWASVEYRPDLIRPAALRACVR